jgi:hypothetical protein
MPPRAALVSLKAEKLIDPLHVRLFCPNRQMQRPCQVSNLLQQGLYWLSVNLIFFA